MLVHYFLWVKNAENTHASYSRSCIKIYHTKFPYIVSHISYSFRWTSSSSIQKKHILIWCTMMTCSTIYLLIFSSFFYSLNEYVYIIYHFTDPALVIPLLECFVANLCNYTYTATYNWSLKTLNQKSWLCWSLNLCRYSDKKTVFI